MLYKTVNNHFELVINFGKPTSYPNYNFTVIDKDLIFNKLF